MRGYLCCEAGRTESVSNKDQLALVAQLKQNKLMCNRERLLMDAALHTAQDLDPLIVSVPKPSKSTIDRLISEMGLKMGNAEVVTPSRELATSDLFHSLSYLTADTCRHQYTCWQMTIWTPKNSGCLKSRCLGLEQTWNKTLGTL